MTKVTTKCEDANTARLVRKARAAVASGWEVTIPKVVVDRLAREKPAPALSELQIRSAMSFWRRSRESGKP